MSDVNLLIGGYTDTQSRVTDEEVGGGIHAAVLTEAGVDLGRVTALRNPSWLTVNRAATAVFAVEENPGNNPGYVVSLVRDPATGNLSGLRRLPSEGVSPAHLALDHTERWLLTANYTSGTVAVHRIDDGGLAELTGVVQHRGPEASIEGTHSERQEAPHPHQIVFDPVNGDVLVPDLGIDSVIAYRLDSVSGKLQEIAEHRIVLKPGTGPRHLVFHPGNEHLFVIGELSATIDLFRRSKAGWHWLQRVTLQRDGRGEAAAAAIVLTPDGTNLLASNRGSDPIVALLTFDTANEQLALIATVTAPATPRAMCLVGDNRLLVAGQDADKIVEFSLSADGELIPRGEVQLHAPTCVVVL